MMLQNRFFTCIMPAILIASCGPKDDLTQLQSTNNSSRFEIGDRPPPLQPPGPGAGSWGSEWPTATNVVAAKAAYVFLGTAAVKRRYGVDAALTFRHYFANSGLPLRLSLKRLLVDVPRVQALFNDLQIELMETIADLPDGHFDLTMKEAEIDQIFRSESENWYLAVAGFSYWLSASLTKNASEVVDLQIDLHIWDRYDWDPGVVIPIQTSLGTIQVDQNRIGEFHRQGVAREYTSVGDFRLIIDEQTKS